ncbi:MAG: 16S rRNA (adenine(1518)-N(6)/adenine(1519)-N(6)) -dimethyltransferase RsmA [Thalassobaculales bacterium]
MSDPVAALPPLRQVIEAAGLSARKSLGQHFLLDLNLTGRIARAGGPLDGTVIEIGPGPGGLTRALLLAGAQHLTAVELDERAIAALAPLVAAAGGRLRLVQADAMALDLASLGPPPRRVVANLPYNVGTALLLKWLERPADLAAITVMLQAEVVDRLAAAPGGKDYGRLSVLVQWLCRVEPLFGVPARAFWPPPRVASTVVRLTPRPAPLCAAPRPALERVTAAAFGQRRKMLRQSLKALGDPEALCAAAGVPATARPEDLPVEAFCAMARAIG